MFYYHYLKRAIKILWEINASTCIFVRFYRRPFPIRIKANTKSEKWPYKNCKD